MVDANKNEKGATREEIWSWADTEKEIQAMHMDPFYNISTTSGLQLRKTFNFNHAIDYLAATTCFGGETFIAVQSLASKSIVHIWNTVQNKNCKVKLQYRMNSFIIIHSLMIGVALCGDGKLRIFTSVPTLVEVAAFPLEKTATYPVYNPFKKDILLGGIGEVNVWSFCEQNKNEPKTLLTEAVRMNLKRGQAFSPEFEDQWVTCISIDERSKQVVIAGEQCVCIVEALTYAVKHVIKTYVPATITQCTLYVSLDYLVTAHQDGSVYIWSVSTYGVVHRIKAHQAKVTGLEMHYGMGLLITISLDKTIKVIRLSTFEEVYNIMTGDKMTNLKVLDRNSLAYCTKYSVKVWNLYQVDTLVNRIFSEVHRIRRTGAGHVLIETEDGGLRLVSCKTGEVITTIFSSTTTADITLKNSTYSSSRNMAYVLNDEQGYLEGYACETHPATLTLLYKTAGQKVVSVCEAYLCIPYWLPTVKRAKLKTETMLGLLIVGTVEGKLIVSDAPDWLHLPPPINIERGIVRDMIASSAGEGDKKCTLAVLTGQTPCYISVYLLAISTDYNLSINLRHVITLTTRVTMFHLSNIYLMVTFDNVFTLVKFPSILEKDGMHSTLMEPMTVLSESYIEIHKHCPSDGHSKTITDMDALATLEIFVTVASEDMFLKLWDNKNNLIREILFSTALSGICFVSDYGNLFCGCNTNIYIIPVTKYLPPQYVQKLLDLDLVIAPYEKQVTVVPSSTTLSEPSVIPISLYNQRKEKMSRLQANDGRYSKCGRKKRDPPRDDEGSKGGRRRETSTRGTDRSHDSNRSHDKSSHETTASSECSDKSYNAVLDALPENIPILEEPSMELIPQNSAYTILENILPCAPDGYIPNSVVRMFFTHLLEFQILFDQSTIPLPKPMIIPAMGTPSQPSLAITIRGDQEDAITQEPCDEKEVDAHVLPLPGIDQGQSISYLFESTTSDDVDSLGGSLSIASSNHLMEAISSPQKQFRDKIPTFAETVQEVQAIATYNYKHAERISIRKNLDDSEISPDLSRSVSFTPELMPVPHATPSEMKSPSEIPNIRKSAKMTKEIPRIRRPSLVAKQKHPASKKRRLSKVKIKTKKPREAPETSPAITQETEQSGSLALSESRNEEYEPLITINNAIPEETGMTFGEKMVALERLSLYGAKLAALVEAYDFVSNSEENFIFVKKLEELIKEVEEERFEVEPKVVEAIKGVILVLYDRDKIDVQQTSDMLKRLMGFAMADQDRFGILSSLIEVQGRSGTTQDVLLEIIPFLVTDDENIKSQALAQLNEFSDTNTNEEVKELLIEMDVLRDPANSDNTDANSDGKVINKEYWQNKIGQLRSVLSKTSQEIISETSFDNDKVTNSNRSIKHSNYNLGRSSPSLGSLTSYAPEEWAKPKSRQSRTLSQPTVIHLNYNNNTAELENETARSISADNSEDDGFAVNVPSIDIKRTILNTTSTPIKHGKAHIGTMKERGKLFNSANDLIMWFRQEDHQFYDTGNRVVGSLLPNGSVSVPDNLELFVDPSIVSMGQELVDNAGTTNKRGKIKNAKGEVLGSLTKEGELISIDGMIFTCDGIYAGKICVNGNRMYINGEIFDVHNRYWGHVGPENTMIHLSGGIFDCSGINIGDISNYGMKLSTCVNDHETQLTDSGVSIDQEERYINKDLTDREGNVLGKFKNKDTIITTCGDIFDRGGVYLGQLLASGHVMLKEEAVRSNTPLVSHGYSLSKFHAKPRKPSRPQVDQELLERLNENRRRRAREIGAEWGRPDMDETAASTDQGYSSEDKLIFDLSKSVPLLPTLNDIRGQRLVKTITFSRSISNFQIKNFQIEPMPSVLNAHTTLSDGKTNFGMLRVDWTTRSFDTDLLNSSVLPPIQPPPSTLPATHPAMKDSSPTLLPRIRPVSEPKKRLPGDYVMRVVSTYLKKELSDEISRVKSTFKREGKRERAIKVCNTPTSGSRHR